MITLYILFIYALYVLIITKHLDASTKSHIAIIEQYLKEDNYLSYRLWSARYDY